MTTTDAPPALDLMFLLAQSAYALTAELTNGLASLGVTPRDHCVLTKALPGDRTQTEIAALAALDKTTMVVTVDGLESAGLAERRPSPTDRRARIVAVTDEGARIQAEGQAIVDGVTERVLGHLDAATRAGLVDGLTRLVTGPLASPVHTERPIRRRARQGH